MRSQGAIVVVATPFERGSTVDPSAIPETSPAALPHCYFLFPQGREGRRRTAGSLLDRSCSAKRLAPRLRMKQADDERTAEPISSCVSGCALAVDLGSRFLFGGPPIIPAELVRVAAVDTRGRPAVWASTECRKTYFLCEMRQGGGAARAGGLRLPETTPLREQGWGIC